ncbi:MAG: TRAP transporter substrate-binding protein DctP [Oscillospiraceae bacterium]|nr:TRAP transporter substrate-binding protein DctP [Oscillospiraceae bacterium]
MKKLLATLLSAALLLSLCAACGAPADNQEPAPSASAPAGPANSTPAAPVDGDALAGLEPRELIVASVRGEGPDEALIAYTDRITERTGGKITFSFFFGGSLAKANEAVDALQNGVCDIMMVNVSNFENLFPLNATVLAVPFMGMNTQTTEVYPELAAKYPELSQEFEAQNLKLLSYSMTAPYNLGISSDKEIRVPSDLAGTKVICLQENIMNFLSAQNAAPVQVGFADFYTSIQGGVAQGIIQNGGPINTQGIYDLLNQYLIFGEDGGLYMELVTYCMNNDVWNSLPDAVKTIFEEEAVEFHTHDQRVLNENIRILEENAAAQSSRYWEMTEEEMAPWKEAMAPFIQEKIDEISAKPGCSNFHAIYDDALAMIADAKK